MMDVFFEVKLTLCILYFLILSATFQATDAVKLDCVKSDECSCKTNTKPQQQVSLWPMESDDEVQGSSWLYAFNLCHGLDKNVNATNGGCQNATVCQYKKSDKEQTFEIGKFGNVTFSQYDNKTKSISLKYFGVLQGNTTRSININLTCDEDGNITKANYYEVQKSTFDKTDFTATIIAKAACLRSVAIPISRGGVATNDGLKTIYIVLISAAGFVFALAIGIYIAYKITRRRRKSLLNEEEKNEDYGTIPQVHVQNAALPSPVSGAV